MKSIFPDSSVTSVETGEGTLRLKTLFVPLFIEQLLMNLMGWMTGRKNMIRPAA